MTNFINIDQSVTILAQISDAFDASVYLLNDGTNIDEVEYTAFYVRDGAFSQGQPVPIQGHTNVDVSTDCVLTSLQTSDKWTHDENGFNFILTPDTTTHPLFNIAGEYQVKVKITLTEGNPIVFYVPIKVLPIDN